jgi:cysteine desulfurase
MARPLYFDYAASTPLDPRVLRAMRPYFLDKFGNAGSLHSYGQEAIAAVDHARETIAGVLGVDFREIIFTGSATEANNLAIRGVVNAYRKGIETPRIIVSAIEHESVLETVRAMRAEGVDVVELPVDKNGVVSAKDLRASLTPQTLLVSIMYANNEIGNVQNLSELTDVVKEFRRDRKTAFPFFHTDAAQAFQFLSCRPQELGVDLMTISAQKIYGPKGVGALYVKSDVGLSPVIMGGGQEFGLRSGTENVPLIRGFEEAVVILASAKDGSGREAAGERIHELGMYIYGKLRKISPKVALNGPAIEKLASVRLPNIVNIHVPGISAVDLVMRADLAGLAISAGSACASRAQSPSYVVAALGGPTKRASESVRLSLGRMTTKTEIDAAIRILKNLI